MEEHRERIIISPGPVHVPPGRWGEVQPMHHRTDGFRRIVRETEAMISDLLVTKSPVYLITSSGTGAMEAALANITRPGSKVMVVSGGKFGDRWGELCGAYNCRLEILAFRPGEAVDIEKVVSGVRQGRPDFLAMVHVESSTGLLLQLEDLLEVLPRPRPIVILDAISSIVSEELEMDGWGIDVVAGACQKAFAAPPGLSFVSMGDRALDLMRHRHRGMYYLSLERYERGRKRGDTPFTPAIQIIQMVHRSLARMKDLGWDTVRRRHNLSSRAFLDAAGHISLNSFTENPSSSVQALSIPADYRGADLVEALADREGIIAARGQGPLRDKLIRTGFLGLYSGETIGRAVASMGAILDAGGCRVDLEAAREAILPLAGQVDLFP